MTSDNVWWFRPDLTLWYDCRSESYYTYDTSLSEYVSVDRERATSALLEGRNVAPVPQYQAASGDGSADAAAASQPDAADGVDGAVLGPIGPDGAPPTSLTTLMRRMVREEDDGGDEAGGRELSGEDTVALQLQSHTESWQGKKDTQEDRYIQMARLSKIGTVFGVFDGHGGVHAAEYVAKHLPNNVGQVYKRSTGGGTSATRRESSAGAGGGNNSSTNGDGDKRLLNALEEAFPLTDRELMSQSRRKEKSDGTTALLVIVHGESLDGLSLYCAHVGDCRAVLCRGGKRLD